MADPEHHLGGGGALKMFEIDKLFLFLAYAPTNSSKFYLLGGGGDFQNFLVNDF